MRGRTPCPCGRGTDYATCCAVFHQGLREAPDAETLMRSRYSAFARGQTGYLWRTLHPDHPDRAQPEAHTIASLRRACERVRYMALTVLDTSGPDEDGVARVLFHARLFQAGRDAGFVEASEFAHDGTGWRYLAGTPWSPKALAGDFRTLTLATLDARIKAPLP